MNSKAIKIISYVAISIAPVILTYYLRKKYKKRLIKHCQSIEKSEYKFIFTTFNNRECKYHLYKRTACSETCSYNYLVTVVRFMETAKQSISLCMCLSTCTEIHDALIRAHNRGVQVRFIADTLMLGATASRATFLKKAGIPIKVQPDQGILHHKFCLADENNPTEAKLFFGSLNLTAQGLTSNWDFIVFTNDKQKICRYQDEFEYLWDSFNYFN